MQERCQNLELLYKELWADLLVKHTFPEWNSFAISFQEYSISVFQSNFHEIKNLTSQIHGKQKTTVKTDNWIKNFGIQDIKRRKQQYFDNVFSYWNYANLQESQRKKNYV